MSAPLSSYDDTHAIAGALKLYFRELPIPLITFECYDLVLVAASKHTHTHTHTLIQHAVHIISISFSSHWLLGLLLYTSPSHCYRMRNQGEDARDGESDSHTPPSCSPQHPAFPHETSSQVRLRNKPNAIYQCLKGMSFIPPIPSPSLRVQSHNNSNLMDSKNLALVFAPSIMRPLGPSNDAAIMIKLPEQKKVTELLISQYPILFS